jgi:hypothetical protein
MLESTLLIVNRQQWEIPVLQLAMQSPAFTIHRFPFHLQWNHNLVCGSLGRCLETAAGDGSHLKVDPICCIWEVNVSCGCIPVQGIVAKCTWWKIKCMVIGKNNNWVKFMLFCIYFVSWDISVSIVTGWGLDGQGSVRGKSKRFLFTVSRPALGPTQPPIQWVPGGSFPVSEADSSPPSSAYVEWWSYTCIPQCDKHRDNFTIYLRAKSVTVNCYRWSCYDWKNVSLLSNEQWPSRYCLLRLGNF